MANQSGATVERLGRLRTPKGTAAFAYLKKPDTSFNKRRHRITVVFDKTDPEYIAFANQLVELATDAGLPKKAVPIKAANERLAETLDIEVGTPYIEAESKIKDGQPDGEVPVFNARGQLDSSLDVWGGDLVRLEVSAAKWEMSTGKGLKLYLNAAQLLKSSGGGQKGSTFGVEEEFLNEDSPAADDTVGATLADEGSDISEDDLPF